MLAGDGAGVADAARPPGASHSPSLSFSLLLSPSLRGVPCNHTRLTANRYSIHTCLIWQVEAFMLPDTSDRIRRLCVPQPFSLDL